LADIPKNIDSKLGQIIKTLW